MISDKKGAAVWNIQGDCSVFSVKKAGLLVRKILNGGEVAEQKKKVAWKSIL